MGQGRGVGTHFQAADCRSKKRILDARHDPCPRPPTGGDRKRGARDQALGRSRGGLTTKIHMLVDTLGRPLRFKLAPGQEGDVVQAPAMIEGFKARAVLADTAYDSRAFREAIETSGAKPVIPSNPP